ncbi:MAG: translation elongation factor 4 [Oscillospiraceae bacterium]|nr:translation elongation factor 4 [Oscillospiraceae bacterium]
MTELSKIRNFSIIAHIDHGKSTLADRLLEECKAITQREMESQILDSMELEKERGITIKATAATMNYTASDGETYVLNLIDTPGHVDFNYEVSRSMAACEGAILVVDASQGVEAQTLANTYLAIDAGLEVLPVINKIDLPSARPAEVKAEVEDIIGLPAEDSPEISAKNGINIPAVLEMIVEQVPPPSGDREAPLQALIFDSQYDSYRGVIVYTRIKQGTVRAGMDIRMMATGAQYKVVEVGTMSPRGLIPCDALGAGEVGYITASIKTVADTQVGDTITELNRPAAEPLPGYREVMPMVFSGVYPADGAKYQDLRDSLEKLKLNDASFVYEPESSIALGFGFRCGFLGLLHMEIIQERLEREYNLDLITTAPNVVYRVTKTDGTVLMVDNPLDYPDPMEIAKAEEPFVKINLIAPQEYVGNMMDLATSRRGEFKDMVYLDANRVELHYDMPLNEIIYDFFDALKSRTRGYGSLDYELIGYRDSKLVKLDILLNGDIVDALSFILFADNAYPRARKICEKLKENIPRAQFEIPVQAAIGGKIIARETIKAVRKDVLAKCYGGDITRKKKLLEKQKEGKKRMRTFGTVSVPSEAFMAVLKLDED